MNNSKRDYGRKSGALWHCLQLVDLALPVHFIKRFWVINAQMHLLDMRRNSSGRSYLRPLGFQQLQWVLDANMMVARAVLIQLLVTAQASQHNLAHSVIVIYVNLWLCNMLLCSKTVVPACRVRNPYGYSSSQQVASVSVVFPRARAATDPYVCLHLACGLALP